LIVRTLAVGKLTVAPVATAEPTPTLALTALAIFVAFVSGASFAAISVT
jgi:hypothetical protein